MTNLTAASVQMCYAVAAADWLVFSPLAELKKNGWARWSLYCALGALGVNLLTAYVMSEWHRIRYAYAEDDWLRWEREFQHNAGVKSSWPASGEMECFALVTRLLKTLLPLAGGMLLAIGFFRK